MGLCRYKMALGFSTCYRLLNKEDRCRKGLDFWSITYNVHLDHLTDNLLEVPVLRKSRVKGKVIDLRITWREVEIENMRLSEIAKGKHILWTDDKPRKLNTKFQT